MDHPVLVTGSEGFIGSHVCERLGSAGAHLARLDLLAAPVPRLSFRSDVRCPDQLRAVASIVQPRTIIHLAAKAEVVIPFGELADLMATNVNGTINVLDTMRPERLVFASSSAVYGNGSGRAALARWSCVNPLGAYGISKAAAEIVCGEWVRNTGGVSVNLRFGNVIGPRCRGLISYLVEHALADPDGARAAPLRGNGTLVRDYVPVTYAARAIELAAEVDVRPGSAVTLNVGTGRGLTNGEVAQIVQRVLRDKGFTLTTTFGAPAAPGEARRLVLDTAATTRLLGLPPPSADEVVEAIEEATIECLAPVTVG